MRWVVAPICAVLLGACTVLDRTELSDFTPTGPTTFVYRASTNYFYTPGAWSDAERTRLEWLGQYLRLNDMCEAGHVIVGRSVHYRATSTLGNPIDDIVYQGRCRADASG
jgi:hypothetical protein